MKRKKRLEENGSVTAMKNRELPVRVKNPFGAKVRVATLTKKRKATNWRVTEPSGSEKEWSLLPRDISDPIVMRYLRAISKSGARLPLD